MFSKTSLSAALICLIGFGSLQAAIVSTAPGFDYGIRPDHDDAIQEDNPDLTVNHSDAVYVNQAEGEPDSRRAWYKFQLPNYDSKYVIDEAVFEIPRGTTSADMEVRIYEVSNYQSDGTTFWTEFDADNQTSDGSSITWNNQPAAGNQLFTLRPESGPASGTTFYLTDGVLRDPDSGNGWKLQSQALLDYLNAAGPGGYVSFTTQTYDDNADGNVGNWWFRGDESDQASDLTVPNLNIGITPEPSSISLLFLTGLAALLRRRRT